jgi:hypothetical protein
MPRPIELGAQGRLRAAADARRARRLSSDRCSGVNYLILTRP